MGANAPLNYKSFLLPQRQIFISASIIFEILPPLRERMSKFYYTIVSHVKGYSCPSTCLHYPKFQDLSLVMGLMLDPQLHMTNLFCKA